MNKKRHWYDYLWIVSIVYFVLGFINILFAWLGMLCFMIPLLFALIGGNKHYCNKYCGRSQLLDLLGQQLKLSAGRTIPSWLRSHAFRYGFLLFFMLMFANMLFTTYLVFEGSRQLQQNVGLLWLLQIPWHWAYSDNTEAWVAQFAFGFYGIMLTSTIMGIITMLLFKPRSWCVYCPMGTMTQLICRWKHKGEV